MAGGIQDRYAREFRAVGIDAGSRFLSLFEGGCMRNSTKVVSITLAGTFIAAAASIALLAMNGSEVKAQTPPAPCACSRATAVVGIDEVSNVPGQFQARFGIIHCQCGSATCVSQIPFASGGVHQLMCVK
jgi:hypothetical protein